VNYFFGNELGNNAYSIGHSENYQGTLGIDIKLTHDWHLGFDGTAGKDHDRDEQLAELNNGNLAAALASGNPATALNVFGGANSPAVVNSVFANRFYAPGDTGEQVFEGKLDGPLFHMPGGDVRAAVGGQVLGDFHRHSLTTTDEGARAKDRRGAVLADRMVDEFNDPAAGGGD